MKISRKIIRKFLKKRVYMWDLKYTDDKHDNTIVIRYITGTWMSTYADDDTHKSTEIVDKFNDNVLFQIRHHLLLLASEPDAFMFARKLCQNHKEFKIKLLYYIPEIKNPQ